MIFSFTVNINTIFLAGTGRSGTTWLAELINSKGDYRLMFEPFHSKKVDMLKDWNYRQYIRPDDHNLKYLKPSRKILLGKIRHPWIDSFSNTHGNRRRIVKDIRANLFIRWIKNHFPDIPIILLLRHPCAVASSKRKLGWEAHLDVFLSQPELMVDFPETFAEDIEKDTDHYEKQVFMWFIKNVIPTNAVQQPRNPGGVL